MQNHGEFFRHGEEWRVVRVERVYAIERRRTHGSLYCDWNDPVPHTFDFVPGHAARVSPHQRERRFVWRYRLGCKERQGVIDGGRWALGVQESPGAFGLYSCRTAVWRPQKLSEVFRIESV